MAYFRNVGAVLFALLLLADYFCPQLPVVEKAAVHPPIIRIFSVENWPERVVFDTARAPVPSPAEAGATVEIAGVPDVVAAPAIPVEASPARDAFAMLPKPDVAPQVSVGQHRRQHRPPYRAARPSRYYGPPPTYLAMRHRQYAFGFFEWR
ncbi:hypothetical protein JQ604_00580 [Bradyrhizobium jicamae]|uniref:hypothetical protein n=1 Tax=Bradyrhizobium jicamae TaxID=280332 RepID=UPI001BA7F509|nr:hypothetical protein [Bradyrhizobium jicamae]MBR0750672.1 hypothetical protein [Bradyrhizobium jicamae]